MFTCYDTAHKITSPIRGLEIHDPHVGTGHRPRPNYLLSGPLQIRTISQHALVSVSHELKSLCATRAIRPLPVWKPVGANWDGGDAPSPHVGHAWGREF